MKIPAFLINGTTEHDRKILLDMNYIANIIWQSERETFKDCEIITEQIIFDLCQKGYIR